MRLSHTQRVGFKAELWALNQITSRLFIAEFNQSFNAGYDILIDETLRCEVKFSHQITRKVRPGLYRPCWQFDIRQKIDRDMIFILICEDNAGKWHPFIVPSWYLFRRCKVQITSHPTVYRGMYADCLNHWVNIVTVLNRLNKLTYQLPLKVVKNESILPAVSKRD
jgi:hypothetical protein